MTDNFASINSAFNSGVQGFSRASDGLKDVALNINRRAAQEREIQNLQDTSVGNARDQQALEVADDAVNQPTTPTAPDFTDSLVQLRVEQRNAEVNAKTIETADDVLGTIIDVRV
ncbi:hypothetical protein [Flocculibacter collagenilyticus]|uniref:hypothetical protein n=1 Tax=Flocculibacter collagenilyticus TaxID=2744479 RepID=UPI0018F37332|nr:hypothetical protein [Flocculibacter collagenilyticus]